MYHHNNHSGIHYTCIFLLSVLLFTLNGCEKLLPTQFKAKDFTASNIDIKACNLLTSDTLNDSQGFTVSYQYMRLDNSQQPISLSSTAATPPTVDTVRSKPVTWSSLNSVSLGDTTDNQTIFMNFASLTTQIPAIPQDSLVIVHYPSNAPVSYAVLKPTQTEDVYLYTSLFYYYRGTTNTSNFNDYVSVDLVQQDTSVVSFSSTISTESAYGASECFSLNGPIKILPAITARYGFHLVQGNVYLVRFTLTNPAEISNPMPQNSFAQPAYDLSNKFKAVILSY